MSNPIVDQIIEIAKGEVLEHPERQNERCGVIVQRGKKPQLLELRNVSTEPWARFEFDPDDWAQIYLNEELLEMWHTHPGERETADATHADLVMIEEFGVPWHIVSWPGAQHSYTKPSGYVAPYEGRVFCYGIVDCFSLCRDWLQREAGIIIPNGSRWDGWWKEVGNSLYLDRAEEYNFEVRTFNPNKQVDLKSLKRGDMLLMDHMSAVPNHAGIYLGDGTFLHHFYGRLSQVAPYGGQWLKITTHVARHRSLP